MKLYYSKGACSLADHIALREAAFDFELERVDLKEKRTESGDDYTAINPKGYVPALKIDTGEILSENIAVLDWIATQKPELAPSGAMGRTHLLEALAYISTEVHKSFKPIFTPGSSDEDKAKAGEMVAKRLTYLAETMKGDYLLGDTMTVADAYLFVMLLWARKNAIAIRDPLPAWFERMMARPAVAAALEAEGLGGRKE